jgi:hypothetical protein
MPELWSVRLVLTAQQDRALVVPHDQWPIIPELHELQLGGLAGAGYEDEPYITFVLSAQQPEEAERLAQSLAYNMRNDADSATPLPVAWVAPLRKDDPDSHRFLEQAKELFDEERYDLAVVAAQVHLELQIRTLLERVAERGAPGWAKRLVKLRPWAALGRSDPAKGVVEALLGIDPSDTPEWPEIAAHFQRRHGVVHEGQQIERGDAFRSIAAVQSFWARLADAARQAE